jgi:hypothetical protein
MKLKIDEHKKRNQKINGTSAPVQRLLKSLAFEGWLQKLDDARKYRNDQEAITLHLPNS